MGTMKETEMAAGGAQSATGARRQVFAAPGRVNLMGEHTDTSEGFVMPAALEFRTIAALEPLAEAEEAVITAENFGETVRFHLRDLPEPRRHWSDYPVGVLWSLRERGIACKGFSLTLRGNVPQGAGLSSSASVEVATALALLAHAGVTLPMPEVARLCQRAENGFVGAQCGIMDQFISCCGKQDHALLLDCRTLDYELLPLPATVRLVICNTMVKHSNASGGYNSRRADVEAALQIVRRGNPAIRTLRDASEADMQRHAAEMPAAVLRRCRHVLSENQRTLEAAAALRSGAFARFGALMLATHASMRDDYEASCAEADLLVELAMRQPGCYGARITGAGWGGCTVNLVEAGQASAFMQAVSGAYLQATGRSAEIYLGRASNGAGPVE
jgi:galactokinase